ncbi:MAG: DNA polymerase III subunit delta [Pseudomonadota bacterium]
MAVIKPQGFEASFSSSSSKYKGALLCGPNWELLNRLKNLAVRGFTEKHPDGEVVRLSDTDLAADTGRLLEELQSISMFGADKLILVDAASSSIHKACIGAISVGWSDCLLLVTAGDLKKSSPLRKEFEASPDLAITICFDQSTGELLEFAASFMSGLGVTIDRDAIEFVVDAVGGNAALLQSELVKLASYAGDDGSLSVADVTEIIAGNEAASLEGLIDAVFSGNPDAAVQAVMTLQQQGQQPASVLIALTNHCTLLVEMAAAMESGRRPDAVVKEWRPPIFFKRHNAITAQLRLCGLPQLLMVAERLRIANSQVRRNPLINWPLAERFIISAASSFRRAG